MSILELYYDSVKVGNILDPFESDNTSYGIFELSVNSSSSALVRHLVEYIEFCEDWNRREYENTVDPPDASEFEAFSDIRRGWRTRDEAGEVRQLHEPPVFFPGNEVSW